MSLTPIPEIGPEGWVVWRKQLRETLLEHRLQAGSAQRRLWSAAIAEHLAGALPAPAEHILGFCWPYKGEPDVLPTVRRWVAMGGTAALPVVVRPREPMIFRRWTPDTEMTRGVYNIPIPAHSEEVHPDILLVPLTGFDGAGYRLGYGGGFFDRTVVTLSQHLLCIGIGFELSRLPTIHPQPHDQPMNLIITEAGVHFMSARAVSKPPGEN